MAIIALIHEVDPHAPILGSLHVSAWFWVAAACLGLVIAQLLAARTLVHRPKPDATVAQNINIKTVNINMAQTGDGEEN